MKDLLIGCATNYNWSKLKYWINSINRTSFTGDKYLILMNCDAQTMKKVGEHGFNIIAFNQDAIGNIVYDSPMMVYVYCFILIYNILSLK